MKIKELVKLRKQEMSGKLRMPKSAKNIEGISELGKVISYIKDLSSDKPNYLVCLYDLKSVSLLKGDGTKNNPYEIKTEFGSGSFYKANLCFKDETTPKDIVKQRCFNNCYLAVIKGYISDCEILNGIAYQGGDTMPFLHSVIKQNDKILDFNYNICMDEELYFKLFNFEVLSEISSKKLLGYYPIIKDHQQFLHDKGISTLYATWTCDDLVDYLINQNMRENIEILKA